MFINRFLGFLPKSNLKKALSFLNKGEYKRSCREFEAYLAHKAGVIGGKDQEMIRMYMVESFIEYARELENAEKYDESAAELEKAVELQPHYADVHFTLGRMYGYSDKTVNARESIKRALAINPDYFRARIMLAKSYRDDKKHDRCAEEIERAMSAAPNFFIEQVRELSREIRIEPDGKRADDLFERLLEERPSSSQVSKQIALEAVQNGDYEYAITELKKSVSMNPNYPDMHNLLGIAYANMGMTDDAVMEFEIALKVNPEYLKARINMALTLYEKGSSEAAMTHLKVILNLDPENELANNLLKELEPVLNKR
ncbi:MAG: tetratricopeptide repeat protein [Candidatus Krumholzibacteria bacterium]|nr:tetratricopeptide repeat protein [Candidatus Krumholzibacteria bacterium]